MNIGRYAPSAQFITIALSLVLSCGLVLAAERFTNQESTAALNTNGAAQSSDAQNWEATLADIQADNASTFFEPSNPQTISELLQAAQTSNVTDAVGRTLLINLSNAKSQGLGDDAPTQDQILAAASAQLKGGVKATYRLSDLTTTQDTDEALKVYGNAVIRTLSNHGAASEQATLLAIDSAVHNNDKTQLHKLSTIADAYQAITTELLITPVPKTLSPLHLSVVNSYATITSSYADMKETLTDPLRGIVGLQTYEGELDKLGRVFTSIAQSLSKNGILFTNDEPGVAWKAFVTSP